MSDPTTPAEQDFEYLIEPWGESTMPQITLEWPAFTGATGVVLAITKDGTPSGLHIIEDGGATEYGPFEAEGYPESVWAGVARPIGSPVDATIKDEGGSQRVFKPDHKPKKHKHKLP